MNKGFYYDGKTTKPTEVTVRKRGAVLIITDLNGNLVRNWNISEIKSTHISRAKQVQLQYGNFPYESLELDSLPDDLLKQIHRQQHFVKDLEYKVTQTNPVKVVIGSLLVIIGLVVSYIFVVAPFVGEQAIKLVPKSIEVQAGDLMYDNLKQQFDINEEKSELLQQFYDACNFESEYDIQFTYSDKNMINAFALPGGKIIVFNGIVQETESWDELAALLAHELAHVNERHSFKALSKSLSSYLIISVLTGDVAGISSIILENAGQINNMANSRIYEKEADMIGSKYLQESQIHPEALSRLFHHFKHTEDGETNLEKKLEFLSTHPLTSKRIAYINELANQPELEEFSTKENLEAKRLWEELKK